MTYTASEIISMEYLQPLDFLERNFHLARPTSMFRFRSRFWMTMLRLAFQFIGALGMILTIFGRISNKFLPILRIIFLFIFPIVFFVSLSHLTMLFETLFMVGVIVCLLSLSNNGFVFLVLFGATTSAIFIMSILTLPVYTEIRDRLLDFTAGTSFYIHTYMLSRGQ